MSEFRWKKYGNYAITSNGYSIAKYKIANGAKYILWDLPNTQIKIFNTPQEAKDYAVDHYKTKPTFPSGEARGARLLKEMENRSYGK
jgi:hypothetical protein